MGLTKYVHSPICLCLSLYLSLLCCFSLSHSLCLSLSHSLCLSISVFLYLCISVFLYLSLYLSISLSLSLSVISLSVYLSLSLCVFQSHFGIGTDVYITLNHIGDQEEALFFEERPDLRQDQTPTR